jgi:hypothetical protein
VPPAAAGEEMGDKEGRSLGRNLEVGPIEPALRSSRERSNLRVALAPSSVGVTGVDETALGRAVTGVVLDEVACRRRRAFT